VQAEGAIYDFFDTKVHVIDFPQSQAREYIVGIDYGTTNPCTFILLGYNPSSYPNLWVAAEYYFDSRVHQRQKTDAEYADDLKKFLQNYNTSAIYVDPSAASFRVELQKSGFNNVYEAKNEVADGIRFVSKYLNVGILKICQNCLNLIKEFQSYVWDPKSQKLGIDKPLKENDHALDALRYAVYSHFYNKDSTRISAEELDQLYHETRHQGPALPAFFSDPIDPQYHF
jgi:PBSX family phage terminase large subunit